MESIIEDYHEYQTVIRGYTPKVIVGTRRELLKLAQYLQSHSLTFESATLVHLENYSIERTVEKSLGYRNLIISQVVHFLHIFNNKNIAQQTLALICLSLI
jgi:site-specific recombinase XerD